MIVKGVVVSVCTVLCVLARPTPPLREYRDVATSQGTVRGYLTREPPHFAYIGLPYARPPTRRDRFKAPKPPPEWDGIFEATYKIKCPQSNADGEENCLVVNVFTPEPSATLPVIVFVHDGDFQNGWGANQAPASFIKEGFVIVTFNFRLGALGFLCLNTPEAPGNAGLKDVIAALNWVNRNIEHFGGNKEEVTVYGTGAGSVAVQLVLLSGLGNGLLNKVILESGSALSPSSITYDPLTTAYNGATSLGYEGTNETDELYEFYKETAANDLSTITETFLPCIDNESGDDSFIDSDPVAKLKDENFYNVSMLITFTHKDQASVIGGEVERYSTALEHFDYLLPNNLEFENYDVKYRLADVVKHSYFGEEVLEGNVVQNYADYIHDILTEYPIIKMAMLFAIKNTQPVYVMQLSLPEENLPEETNFNSALDYLYYKNDDESDDILVKLVSLLKNFIKFGDPTPLITTFIPLIWQPVPSSNELLSEVPVLQFDTNLKMTTPPRSQWLVFWENIYRRFYRPHIPN